MESWKDNMTDNSDKLENNNMTVAEELSPAIEQRGSRIHKQECNEKSSLPADYIRTEDMKIKHVAKNHVLPFLPAKSLIMFRAVSKEWNNWIVSPLLAYQQSISFQKLSGYFYQSVDVEFQSDPNFLSLDRSSSGVPSPSLVFLPERVKVISSSSGLLLCQGRENYFVCNPVTEDWKLIPRHQCDHGSDSAAVLAFDPEGNIESYYHIVAAVPLPVSDGPPVVFFEIYSSESNSWRCSSSDRLVLGYTSFTGGGFYMKGMAYWKTTSNDVLAFDVKNEITAVLHVPIPPERYGALTRIKDELSYVTAYNDCGDIFMLDIYEGIDLSLKRSVCVNFGHKRPRQALERNPCIDKGAVSCSVLPCNSSEDMVVIYTTERIYLYHLSGQNVETLTSPAQIDPQRRFIPYTNSLATLHELKD